MALLFVAISLLLSLWLTPFIYLTPFLFFFPAVIGAAWIGGLRPGLLATVLASLSVNYYLLPPYDGFNLDAPSLVRTGAFAMIVGTVSWFAELARTQLQSRDAHLAELQAAHKALLEQSLYVEGFFKHSISPLVFLDRDFNFIRVNEAYARVCQKKVDDFPGHNHFEFYPSDAKAIFEEVVRTRQPSQVAARPFVFPDHPDWGVTYWDWKLTPLLDERGEVEFLVFALEDVTARKLAEIELEKHRELLEELVRGRTRELGTANAQLRENEERFRLLVDGAKDHAIFMLDPDGRVVSWNSSAETIKGYTAPEIIGRHISCFYVPEDVEHGAPERLLKAAAEHGLVEDEGWRVRKDGSRFWAEVAVSALRDDSGRIRGFGKIVRDVSMRKQAEADLRTSQERLAAIIGSAMDAIITVDKDQRIIVFNTAAEKIFGCPAAEAIGQTLGQFIPERFREAHHSHLQKFGSTGATSRSMYSPGTLYGRRANGEEFPLEATISQVTISGEKLYTVILRDITQRKQTEAALMRSEKLATVGRLAATVAHEINNPLQAVTSLLYVAELSPSLDEAARGHLRMAGAEVARAAQIAKQTLGFAKVGAAVSRFRPADVLESVLALLERKLRNKEVICEKEFSGHVEIQGVESEIRQIFWNLLSNSLDAVPSGGHIKLRVSPSRRNGGKEGIRVTIADDGSGISADHLPHLFDPFFTTKETGNGLGLWITSEIVRKHGGSIRVRSRNGVSERTGTVFSIFLPAEATSVGGEMQAAATRGR